MATSGNVYFPSNKEFGIYLYKHYDAYDLPKLVQRGLIKGNDRFNDLTYLIRIVFENLKSEDPVAPADKPDLYRLDVLGYGISTECCFGDVPLIVIGRHLNHLTIGYCDMNEEEPSIENCYVSWLVTEFVTLSQEEISFEANHPVKGETHEP